MTKTKRVDTRLEENLYAKLLEFASKEGVKKSTMIRRFIERGLKNG